MALNQPREVYVVFSKTSTGIGKMICDLTHSYYNHVSLSFDKNLSAMYSFGRRYVNSPLVGGFIIERPARYLAADSDIYVKVCRIELTEAEYSHIRELILHFFKHRDDILYNTFGALCSLIGRRGDIKDAYTCIGFVTNALGISGVLTIPELELLMSTDIVYCGNLRGIAKSSRPLGSFFVRQGRWQICWGTAVHFSRLIGRACGGGLRRMRVFVGRSVL